MAGKDGMTPRHTWDGDDDAEAVAIATNYLNSNLPEGYYAVSQPYLLVDPGGEHATSLVMNVQKGMLKTMRSGYRMVVAHPDIVVMRESVDTGWANMIVCAVELDGSIHDSRPGKKQTDKRNKKYRLAEVPVVQVNAADCHEAGIEPLKFMYDGVEYYRLGGKREPIVEAMVEAGCYRVR